ncbi:MAG: C40 family peptidase [Gammaproteobacteria bacterium]|nr:C40 family peptidase [Gammaproteobacteria bacterium]
MTRHWQQLAFSTIGLMLLAFSGCSTVPQRTDAGAGARAVEYALKLQGTPYRYGGNSPRRGFDCSGLVQYSYSRVGLHLPRSTDEQWAHSRPVDDDDLRPGDLLFFDQDGKTNSHVGMYIGDDRFVHAPSRGKRVSVGNVDDPYWREHYAGARRPLVE